ncbi:MAG: hypothetical protein PHN42_00390 [Bacilli bacterium]|nr:hypothetical protein [Bacilli bacterium]
MNIEQIIENGKEFYDELIQDENGRFKSWEYCYRLFYNNIDNELTEELLDYLSLNLFMYLASWGMYRGSSFLLNKDYKIHKPVIKEIFNKKYRSLLAIKSEDYLKIENQDKLIEIVSFMQEYYLKVRESIKDKTIEKGVSDTLITKILLGTLGCVPAYDEYFIKGIRKYKVASGMFNNKSIINLVNFYIKYEDVLEEARANMNIKDDNIKYPQMKLLDMCFWKAGKR